MHDFSTGLHDILLAAVMCNIEIVPWLLNTLLVDLKSLVSHFPVIVPESTYLPAPPIYCLQPTQTTEVLMSNLSKFIRSIIYFTIIIDQYHKRIIATLLNFHCYLLFLHLVRV